MLPLEENHDYITTTPATSGGERGRRDVQGGDGKKRGMVRVVCMFIREESGRRFSSLKGRDLLSPMFFVLFLFSVSCFLGGGGSPPRLHADSLHLPPRLLQSALLSPTWSHTVAKRCWCPSEPTTATQGKVGFLLGSSRPTTFGQTVIA